MRILVVTQYFWPETFRINELVEMFTDQGHQVHVLTGIPNYPSGTVFPEFSRDPSRYLQWKGAEITRVPMSARQTGRIRLVVNYATFAFSASIVGLWKLRKHKFDAVFAYEPSPITVGIPTMVMRFAKRAPSCLWILDLWPETPHALGMLNNRWLYRLTESLVKVIYRWTDLLLVQSPGFEKAVRKYTPADKPVRYFPSWADAVFDGPLPDPAPEVAGDPDVFSVLFAGNIGEAQDFESILRTAELLKARADIRFLIVGDGRQLDWVTREIEVRGLASQVLLLGRHPVDRMPEFFAHADALLVTLRPDPVFSATIPAKVQAYMASGIPIVGLLDGEGADAVMRWECGLVARAGDAAGLANAITTLADSDTETLTRMGDNGRRGAAAEFNRHDLVDELLGWMSELVEGRRKS